MCKGFIKTCDELILSLQWQDSLFKTMKNKLCNFIKGPTNSLMFFIRCNPQQLLHLEECNPVS